MAESESLPGLLFKRSSGDYLLEPIYDEAFVYIERRYYYSNLLQLVSDSTLCLYVMLGERLYCLS
jgi:hypothetical protein